MKSVYRILVSVFAVVILAGFDFVGPLALGCATSSAFRRDKYPELVELTRRCAGDFEADPEWLLVCSPVERRRWLKRNKEHLDWELRSDQKATLGIEIDRYNEAAATGYRNILEAGDWEARVVNVQLDLGRVLIKEGELEEARQVLGKFIQQTEGCMEESTLLPSVLCKERIQAEYFLGKISERESGD